MTALPRLWSGTGGIVSPTGEEYIDFWSLLQRPPEVVDLIPPKDAEACESQTSVGVVIPREDVRGTSPAQSMAAEDVVPAARSDAGETLDNAAVIATIRSSLSLQIAEIAEILHVERPTIYTWIGGQSRPTAGNRKRLHWLYRLAQEWDDMSSTPVGEAVRQIDVSGKTLLDLLKEGKDSEIRSRFRSIARQFDQQVHERLPTAHEIAAKYGWSTEPKEGARNELDILTGKRFCLE